MFDFLQTFFTNPVVIAIFVIVLIQMGFSIFRTLLSLRQSRQDAAEMERLLQESESRMRDVIRDIENNRKQLSESLERINHIQQKNNNEKASEL